MDHDCSMYSVPPDGTTTYASLMHQPISVHRLCPLIPQEIRLILSFWDVGSILGQHVKLLDES